MSKNVAVFVDVANIFYAAKAAGVDIDYVTLLKAAVAGRDFVRAYAYTGLDPENENQRNFHSFLARHGYKVVSKDIRKYGDGKVKANLDIELVVDMMKTARNLDVAIVVSGDGDFAPAIRAVQEMGVRVEVISFRGNTSSDLIDVADVFTDIIQIARVDRESSRSGRRVAGDEEDLSMTEVPEKQTEGRGGRRRGRGRPGETRVAAEAGRGRAAARPARPTGNGVAAAGATSGARMVVLPGERLSRVQGGEAEAEPIEEFAEELAEGLVEEQVDEATEAQAAGEAAEGDVAAGERADEAGRRRRRRGGRGRGRGGRVREEEGIEPQAAEEVGTVEEIEPTELPPMPATAAPRPNPFGSVWDSQIGMVGQPTQLPPLSPDEEDYAEPEIPEYLLAERRRGRGGRGAGGGRGARSAYASAMERERFGRPRYPEPVRQAPQPQRRREERPPRQPQPPQQQQHRERDRDRGRQPGPAPRTSSEPWSEVPPELEELLRAQLANKLTQPAHQAGTAERTREDVQVPAEDASAVSLEAAREAGTAPETAAPRRRAPARRRTAASTPAAETVAAGEGGEVSAAGVGAPPAVEAHPPTEAELAPKRRAPGRRRTASAAEAATETAAAPAAAAPLAGTPAPESTAAPKRRAPARRRAAADAPAAEPSAEAPVEAAPKRRAPARRRAAASAGAEAGGEASSEASSDSNQ